MRGGRGWKGLWVASGEVFSLAKASSLLPLARLSHACGGHRGADTAKVLLRQRVRSQQETAPMPTASVTKPG